MMRRVVAAAFDVLMDQRFVVVVFVSGIVLRLLTALIFPVVPESDAAWYVKRAVEIAEGAGYQEGGHPTAYWPVGWPAALAAAYSITGSVFASVLVLNLVGAGIAMVALVALVRVVTDSESAARIALSLYAFYPNHIAYASQALTETFYTGLLVAAVALMVAGGRRRVAGVAVSGLLFGLAALVKPQTLALPPILAVVAAAVGVLAWREAGWRLVVTILLMVVVIAPWTWRNYVVFGELVLISTNGGIALLQGANDEMTGKHMLLRDTPVHEALGIPWEERVERQVELDKRRKAAAVEWIKENPGKYIAWMPRKVFYLWRADTDGFWAFERQYGTSPGLAAAKWANQAYYVAIMGLSLAGLVVALFSTARRRVMFLAVVPAFFSVLAAVFTGQIRYHYPAMPFLMGLSGYFLAWAHARYRMTRLGASVRARTSP